MPTPTRYFQTVASVLTTLPSEPIEQIIATLRTARANGQRIFMCGNGRSSANASHIVNDMLKSTIQPGQPRFKLICLSDNVPTLTAYANDISYDVVFAEPLASLAEPGDVVIALSGSGNSPNVLNAMEAAKKAGATAFGLAGYGGGKLAGIADRCITLASTNMQLVEDVHMAILHAAFAGLRLRLTAG